MSSEEERVLRDLGSDCKNEKTLEAFEQMIDIITRFNSHFGCWVESTYLPGNVLYLNRWLHFNFTNLRVPTLQVKKSREDKCFAPCRTVSPAKSGFSCCPSDSELAHLPTLSYLLPFRGLWTHLRDCIFQSWLQSLSVYLNSPKYWISIYSSILSHIFIQRWIFKCLVSLL